MRVFCPNCSEPINIADDLAGKATFCPLCKAPFSAPALFTGASPTPATITSSAPSPLPPPAPTPSAPAPSTYGVLPPAPVPAPPVSTLPPLTTPKPAPNYSSSPPAPTTPVPTSSATPPTGGYSRSFGFSISPEIIQWTAPVCLAIALFLTVFSWNGAYPGGHGVYTQSPWGAMFGNFSTDPVGDDVFKYNPKKPKDDNQQLLSKQVSMNFLMLMFIPLLFVTTVAAFIFTLLPQLKLKIPVQFEPLVPWRMAIVAAVAAVLVGMVCLQSLRGFGLENALIERSEAEIQTERDEAAKPDQVTTVEIKQGKLRGGLNIQHTFALQLTIWCLVVAMFGGLAAFAMMRRVDKPHPLAASRLPRKAASGLHQLAASSPSNRKVRHFALPPAFKNSSNSTVVGS
jgi:hypothetical protein